MDEDGNVKFYFYGTLHCAAAADDDDDDEDDNNNGCVLYKIKKPLHFNTSSSHCTDHSVHGVCITYSQHGKCQYGQVGEYNDVGLSRTLHTPRHLSRS